MATWRPMGAIRVVKGDEPTDRVEFFCSDPAVFVENVLFSAANPFARETDFRDVNEAIGGQQMRREWASVGAFHLWLWAFILTEA